jgi:calcium binding protein
MGEASPIDREWAVPRDAAMRNIEDIPRIPDQDTRLAEITVDCYGQDEELSAFEVYFTDALQPPFAATWRDLDEPGHAERVTVLGVADVDQRRGILLAVRRQDGKERRVLAEQLWADETGSANAIVLDDYRAWGGVDPGWDEAY